MIKLPSIATNFGTQDINFGYDATFEFAWTTYEGRLNLICNSVDLSIEESTILLGNSTLY